MSAVLAVAFVVALALMVREAAHLCRSLRAMRGEPSMFDGDRDVWR